MASRGLGEPQWDRKGNALAKAGKCRRLFSEEPCVPLLFVPNNTIEIQPLCYLQDTKVLTCLKFAIYGDLVKDYFLLNTRITRPLSPSSLPPVALLQPEVYQEGSRSRWSPQAEANWRILTKCTYVNYSTSIRYNTFYACSHNKLTYTLTLYIRMRIKKCTHAIIFINAYIALTTRIHYLAGGARIPITRHQNPCPLRVTM